MVLRLLRQGPGGGRPPRRRLPDLRRAHRWIEEKFAAVRDRAAGHGRTPRFGLRASLVTGETDADAWRKTDALLRATSRATLDPKLGVVSKGGKPAAVRSPSRGSSPPCRPPASKRRAPAGCRTPHATWPTTTCCGRAPPCSGRARPWPVADIVDKVVPELRERGAYRTAYEGTTLREHLALPPL